jgi:proline dehydrogenase
MLRGALLAAAGRPRLRGWLESTPAGRAVVTRFVAGSDTVSVLRTAEQLARHDLRITIDHLGEHTTNPAAATATCQEYLALLDLLAHAMTAGRADVSVKLSALGQLLPGDGAERAYRHAARICAAARQVGATVTLDMEDHTTTDSTLAILDRLRQDHPETGVAVQARLRRTEADCGRLAASGTRVRLCKGAYTAPAALAHTRRGEVDRAFQRCLEILLGEPDCYPMIATHNPRLIRHAHDAARRYGRAASDHEYQMLYGVRPDEQRRLAATGHAVRVYLPYGLESTAYFLRRLAERPANVAFFLRALTTPRGASAGSPQS